MNCIASLLLTVFVLSPPEVGRVSPAVQERRAEPALQDSPPAPPVPAMDPHVDAILTAVEKSGQALKGVRCKVEYREDDQLNLVVTKRYGGVLFVKTDADPLFLSEFSRTVSDDIVSTKRVWYLFNGLSLIEAREKTKHIVERQVVSPGDKVDFFDLESAPFPMPFGQKKAQIIRHFHVKLVPFKKGDPQGTDHLVCTPKPGSRMERRYAKLEFYILKDIHLPRKIVATLPGGYEITTAVFPDLARASIDAKLEREDFAEPAEWKKEKYTRDVEPFEDESSRTGGSSWKP